MTRAEARRASARRRRFALLGWASVLVGGLLLASSPALHAHKEFTSKYTYNDDVFPILREKCAACHVSGGPSPMSLMTYKDAVPWADSIREELTAERMPPWFVDPPGHKVRGAHTITGREIDILVTWASGGTPEGSTSAVPPIVGVPHEWRGEAPDMALLLPKDHTLPPGIDEGEHDFTVPTGLKAPTWVSAVDLLPGTPALVRSAVIAIENGPILGTWVPGLDVSRTPDGTAFRLPANAVLAVHIRYKKPWQEVQEAVSDQSTIGLYFAKTTSTVQAIQTRSIEAPFAGVGDLASRTVAGSVTEPARLLAIRFNLDQPYASIEVTAKYPDGGTISLLRLSKPRPEWALRYWLADAVDVSGGTRIEATAIPLPAGAKQTDRETPRTDKRFAVELCFASEASDGVARWGR